MAGKQEPLRVERGADRLREPSTIPPISVPHSDPMPPITTASKAKISCIGPE